MRFENLLLEEIMQELNQSVVKFNNINSIYLNNNIERHHDDNVIGNIHDDTYNYTSGSKDINKSLWDIKKGSDSSNRLLNNINNINTNLNDCSPAKDDLIVYSGVRRDPQKVVKETGGLLHHPAFISTSVNPSNALNFACDREDTGIRHVLKIKVRKGQQVGGYLGNKSSYDNENEYLLKANQMLHIHPHYEDFIDANGKTLRVHNAIILEPHEYNHLSSHDEVKSIHRLNDILHEAKKSMDKKIDDDISQGKVDSNYINNNNYIFNNHHIDKLIKNPDLHDDLAYRHTLDKTHIDTMLAAGKVNPEYIVRQRNLTKEHIDKIMDMKNPILNSLLIRNKHIKLDKSIVDNFCKNKLYHRALSESNHITKEHIDHIIDANKDDYYNIYENLSKRSDLSEKNINDIADKQEKHFNENLIKNKDLSETNISKILDWGVDNYYMLSTQKNLNQAHISDILLKSRNSSNYSLSNIMQNHQLNDNNKNIVRNGSNFDDESKKLVDGLIPLPKRVENHPLTYPSL